MFSDEIKITSDRYVSKAKSIIYKSTSFSKDNSGEIKGKLRSSDFLFFDEKGRLLELIETERNRKTVFVYNHLSMVIQTSSFRSKDHLLFAISEFRYDKNSRVTLEKIWDYQYNPASPLICTHRYEYLNYGYDVFIAGNKHKNENSVFSIRNNKHGYKIEEKAVKENGDFIYWVKYELNDNGELLFEYSLDENENTIGLYSYFPYLNGLDKGYLYTSADEKYEKRRGYVFNEKGHWIKQTLSKDNIPQYEYEREITYYD